MNFLAAVECWSHKRWWAGYFRRQFLSDYTGKRKKSTATLRNPRSAVDSHRYMGSFRACQHFERWYLNKLFRSSFLVKIVVYLRLQFLDSWGSLKWISTLNIAYLNRILNAGGSSIGTTSRILNDCDQPVIILEIYHFFAENWSRKLPWKGPGRFSSLMHGIPYLLATDDVRQLEFL